MHVEKTLQEIRDAEARAEQSIADAHEKAGFIVSKGKTDADAFVAERKKAILAEKAEALSSRKKELDKEQQKHLKKTEKEADALVLQAEQNSSKTLSALVKNFKTMLSE